MFQAKLVHNLPFPSARSLEAPQTPNVALRNWPLAVEPKQTSVDLDGYF